jgi:hypothetical protein
MKPKLTEDALLSLLNWELAAYEECAGCCFTSVRRYSGDAANWVDAQFAADHAPGLAERFIANQVVGETRRAFDLA